MSVRVKICGLTNLDDAVCAVEAGADMLGFIFTAKSPRYITPGAAAALVAGLRSACRESGQAVPKLVGVFVNDTPATVAGVMASVGLDYAQLHGSESSEELAHLNGRAFKAIRPKPDEEAEAATEALAFAALGIPSGPRLLVDAYSPAAYGGTGELSDWNSAAQLAAQTDGLMLAGGLNPGNVAAAIAAVRPWAVDVGSGVEAEPGRKDHDAVRAFVEAARGAT